MVSKKIEAILGLVNLDKKINSSIKSLAAGERQRVAIARAIINSPDIILADEPTNNLDQKLSETVMKMLIQLSKYGATVIVTTHELSLAKKFKQNILSINNAEII